MFKNLRKKIEQGVAQSPLRAAIKTPADDSDGSPSNAPSDDGSQPNKMSDGAASFIGQEDSPAKMEPSSQTTFDSSPQSPPVGQLVDIPLSNHPLGDSLTPANGTPQPTRSRQSSISSVTSESPFFPPLNLSHQAYDLPSEAESELEESITSLDGYTKEDLYNVIKRLERRSVKYKGRFKDVVAAYKELQQDKEKIKNTLTQSQDKAFRRISELKEQAYLDKLAKKDLEENYRLMLEEKDEFVRVLQTQVRLLKDGNPVPEEIEAKASIKGSTGDGDSGSSDAQSIAALTEKVKRQEALLNRCKESIKNHKDKIAQVSSENVLLKKQLEDKDVELNKSQDGSPASPNRDEENAKLRRQIKEARTVIEALEADKQLAIAEVKQHMHQAIESKDQEVVSAKSSLQRLTEENQQLAEKVEKLEKTGQEHLQKSREIIKRLKEEKNQAAADMEERLKVAEERLEQEKNSLVQELARGKTEVVTLLQQESEKKMEAIASEKETALQQQVREWEEKMTAMEKSHQEKLTELERLHREGLAIKDKERDHALELKEGEIQKRLMEKEEHMRLAVEERDLQKMAALSQQDSAKDELLQQIDSLNSAKLELENMLIKLREDHEAELLRWRTERESHAAEVDRLTGEFQEATETLKRELEAKLQEQACSLKEAHSQQLDELNQKHQEMLQGSSSEVEEYYRTQLESMKSSHDQLAHDKAIQIETINLSMKELQEKFQTSQKEFEDRLQAEIKTRETLVEKYETEISELKTNIQSLNDTKVEMEKTIESKDVEMNALQVTFKGNLETAENEWKQKLDELESEHEKRVSQISQSDNSRVIEAESRVTQLQQQLEEMVKTQQEMTEAKQTVQDEKEILQTTLEALKNQVEEESHAAAEVRENLAQKSDEVNSLQKTLEEKETALSLLDARCQDLDAEVLQKSKAFEDKSAEIQQMQEKFGQLKTEAKSRIKDLKERTDEMAKDLSEKTEEVLTLKGKLAAVIADLEGRLKESQDAHAALEESFKEKFGEKQKQYKEHLHKMKEAFQAKLNEKEQSFQEKLEEITKQRAENVEGVAANLESLRQQQLEELSASHRRQLEETVSDWESRLAEVKESSASEVSNLKQSHEDQVKSLQITHDNQITELSTSHQAVMEKMQNDFQNVSDKLKEAESTLEMISAQKAKEMSTVTEELRAVKASSLEKETLISDIEASNLAQKEAVSNLEQQLSELRQNMDSATEKHVQEIQEKDLVLQEANNKIEHLQSSNASLEETIRTISDSSKDQEAQILIVKEEQQTVINSLQTSMQERTVLVEELQQKLQSLEGSSSEKETVIVKLNQDLEGLRNQLEELGTSSQAAVSEKENLIAEMTQRLNEASAEIQRLKEHHEESLQRVETEMGARVREQQSEMEERLRRALAEEERLKGELEVQINSIKCQHEQQMQDRDAELARLQEHVNILEKSQEKIKALMAESRDAFESQSRENEQNLQQLRQTKDTEIQNLQSELEAQENMVKNLQGDLQKVAGEMAAAAVESIKGEYDARIADLTANDHELQEQLRQLREKLIETEERLHECIQTYDSHINEYKAKLDKQVQSFTEEKTMLQQQLSDMDAQARLNTEGLQAALQGKVREAEQNLLEAKQDHIQKLEDSEKQSEANLQELKQKYNAKLKEIKGKLMGRINELENVKASELLESSNRIQELEKQLSGEKSQKEALSNELSQSNTKLLQLQEMGQTSESQILEVSTALQERETELAKLKKVASDRENLVSDLIKSQETADQKSEDAEKVFAAKDKEIASLQLELNEKSKTVEELESKLHHISDDIALRLETSEKRHSEKMQEQLKSYAESVEVAQNRTKELESELNNVRAQHTENLSKVSELEDLVRQWKDRSESAQVSLDSSNAKLEELTIKLEMIGKECEEKVVSLQSQHATELQELTERIDGDGNTKVAEYKKKAEAYLVQMRKQFQEERDKTKSQHAEVTGDLEVKLETLKAEFENAKLEKQTLIEAHESERQKLEMSFTHQLKEKEQVLAETLRQSESSRSSEEELRGALQNLKVEKDDLNAKLLELEKEKSEQCQNLEQKVKSLEKEVGKTMKQFDKYKADKDSKIEEINKNNEENLQKLQREYEEERRHMEGTHSSQVKQLVKELNLKLAEKEKEFQDTFREALGKSSRDEDRLMQEHKQTMDELYNDLHEKDQQVEELVEQHAVQLQEKEKEAKDSFAALQEEVTALQEKITLQTESHQRELEGIEQKLEEGFKKRLAEKETAHREEIDALSKEWNTERQGGTLHSQKASPNNPPKELVLQNQFALTAISSGSSSSDLLRQQIVEMTAKMETLKSQHKLELAELQSQMEMSQNRTPLVAPPGSRNLYQEFEPRAAEEIQNLELNNMDLQAQVTHLTEELSKMGERERHLQEKMDESDVRHSASFHTPGASFNTPGASFHTPPSSPYPLSGNSTPSGPLLTEPTEMEYLRNILFQYMIGKETKTLAKVIATVMKFTDDQTSKILSKEDTKAGFLQRKK